MFSELFGLNDAMARNDQENPSALRARKRRFGIGAKILFGFLLSSGLTLCATIVAIYGFQNIETEFDRVRHERLPEISQMTDIGASATRLHQGQRTIREARGLPRRSARPVH